MRWIALLLLIGCGKDYEFQDMSDAEAVEVAQSAPAIEVTPAAIDFGEVAAGASLSEVVTVENVGEEDLVISGVSLDDDLGPSVLSALSTGLLPPGERADFTVTLTAVAGVPLADRVLVDSSDPERPTVEVALTADLLEEEEEPEPQEDEPPFGDTEDTAEPEPEPECVCPEGYEVRPAQDGCERLSTEPAVWAGSEAEICPLYPLDVYGKFGARYPDGGSVRDTFWGQDDGAINGRMNTIGVWACEEAGSSTAGTAPVGEWIGFAVCLEIEEPADYLVGVGADNRVQVYLDGAMIFEEVTGATSAFNYWWMQGLSLESGTHVLEFLAMNDGSYAGYGAEIAGPFEAGSTAGGDKAMMALDYEGSIYWSTSDAIGEAFPIGETVGWICPDGSTYNVCEEEPECLVVERADCL